MRPPPMPHFLSQICPTVSHQSYQIWCLVLLCAPAAHGLHTDVSTSACLGCQGALTTRLGLHLCTSLRFSTLLGGRVCICTFVTDSECLDCPHIFYISYTYIYIYICFSPICFIIYIYIYIYIFNMIYIYVLYIYTYIIHVIYDTYILYMIYVYI